MPALIFDCDGVLADTERYGHLPAFNATFDHFGLPVRWTEQDYARLVKIGGGKERMATLFSDASFCAAADIPDSAEARHGLLLLWHRYKSERFRDLVSAGQIPARPGVRRIMLAALESGWTIAVASTSTMPSVRAVLDQVVGASLAAEIPIYAGDVVSAKKPDPAIYHLALEKLNLTSKDTLVIEDSRNGLVAAHRAGLRCMVTVNDFTRHEDFSEAWVVVSDLGDPDREPIEVLANRAGIALGPHLLLRHLLEAIRRPS